MLVVITVSLGAKRLFLGSFLNVDESAGDLSPLEIWWWLFHTISCCLLHEPSPELLTKEGLLEKCCGDNRSESWEEEAEVYLQAKECTVSSVLGFLHIT